MQNHTIPSVDKKAFYEELFGVPFEQLPKSYYPQDELDDLCSSSIAKNMVTQKTICGLESMSAVMTDDYEVTRSWNAIQEPDLVDLLRMKRCSGKEFFTYWNINTKKADEALGKGWLDDSSIILNEDLLKKHYLLLEQYTLLQEDTPLHKINKQLINFYQEVGKQDLEVVLTIEKQACEYVIRQHGEDLTEHLLDAVNALEVIKKGIHYIDKEKTPENVGSMIFAIMPIKQKENITKKDLGRDSINKALNAHISLFKASPNMALRKDGVVEARKQNMKAVRTYYTDKQLELVKKALVNKV